MSAPTAKTLVIQTRYAPTMQAGIAVHVRLGSWEMVFGATISMNVLWARMIVT
jgi:hypothetical protein